MMKENISRTEVEILRLFPGAQTTVSHIAEVLEMDISWASRCVSNLVELGFLEREKKGREVFINVVDAPLGTALNNLLMEEPAMNLHALIGGTSLRILPLLLEPGFSAQDIVRRSNLTLKTVYARLKRWRGMGVAVKSGDAYVLNPRAPLVIEFAREYIRSRNLIHQREHNPDAAIVWQDRDDYIISTREVFSDGGFRTAGPPRLAEEGYDIAFRNYYYYHSPIRYEISEAEALVQTLKFDINNPRPLKYIQEAIKNRKVTKNELRKYAKKYGVEKRIEEALQWS